MYSGELQIGEPQLLSMHRFLRHFSIILVVGALWLNYGPGFAAGQFVVDGEVAAASSVLPGTNPHEHDHGPTNDGALHHCVTASCASVFLAQAHGTAMRNFGPPLKVAACVEDRQIQSAYLECDPPIPRISV